MTDEIGLPDGVDHAERALDAFRSNGWTTRKCSNCAGSGRVLDVYTMESSCCYLCAGGGELSTHDEYAAMRAAVAEAVAIVEAKADHWAGEYQKSFDANKIFLARAERAESELAHARAELGRARDEAKALCSKWRSMEYATPDSTECGNELEDLLTQEELIKDAAKLDAMLKEPTNG